MSMAGNEDATERQRAVGTQQIVGGVPKGTHSMAAIYPAIAWLATLLSPSGALSQRMLASLAKLELKKIKAALSLFSAAFFLLLPLPYRLKEQDGSADGDIQ